MMQEAHPATSSSGSAAYNLSPSADSVGDRSPSFWQLPIQMHQTVGRSTEISTLCSLLCHANTRLLTLTGPGGVGKTRLAIEVGRALQSSFRDGVAFVSLAPLREAEQVLPTLAHDLHIEEGGQQPLLERLKTFLHTKHILLILDNFEHVLEAAPLLGALLTTAPHVQILATSRAALHLYGEREFEVLPLALPDPQAHDAAVSDAVTLFVQRAQAVRSTFVLTPENRAAVTEICVQLDGLPLALELAAARAKILSPEAILARLQSRLSFLTGGPRDLPRRQQTLRNTLDWSYDLLTSAEQRFFRHLGVFVGNWTLAAAEYVGLAPEEEPIEALDLLTSLVDKSLVRTLVDRDGETRFLLLETIREYALDRLHAHAELSEIQQRHAEYYAKLAEAAEPHLYSHDQRLWLACLDRETPNLWAAMHWVIFMHQTLLGLRLASALGPFLQLRSSLNEGRNWLEELLALSEDTPYTALRARVLYSAGVLAQMRLARMRNDIALARQRFTASHMLAAETGETRIQALSAGMLALLELHQGNYVAARDHVETGIQVLNGCEDRWCRGILHGIFGKIESKQCHFSQAQTRYRVSLMLLREAGDQRNQADIMVHLAGMMRLQGKLRSAYFLYLRSLELLQAIEDRWSQAGCLNGMGDVLRLQGRYAEARERFNAALALASTLDHKQEQIAALTGVGQLALAQGENELAAGHLKECVRLTRQIEHAPGMAHLLLGLGDLERSQGHWASALTCYERCLTLTRTLGDTLTMAGALFGQGDIARVQGRVTQSCTLLKQSLHLSWEIGNRPGLAAALEVFAWLCGQMNLPERATQFLGSAEALRESLQIPLSGSTAIEHTHQIAALRTAIGEAAFAECWSYGKTMSLKLAMSMVARITPSEQLDTPTPKTPSSNTDGLTARELDVLRLLAQGLTDARIAEQLVLSPRTINTHLRSIYAKLGVSSRSAATRYALEHKLV